MGIDAISTAYTSEDPLFIEALHFFVDKNRTSCVMLERRHAIGRSRAARIMSEMERNGFISPRGGTQKRKVLISKAQFFAWQKLRVNREGLL
jgi:DNA segregation ATPase FtsK/SpoIIIE-like protein